MTLADDMTDTIKAVAEAQKEYFLKAADDNCGYVSEDGDRLDLLIDPVELAKAAIEAIQIREMTASEVCEILNKTGWYNEYGVCEMDKEAIVMELAKLGTIRIVEDV